MANVKGKDDYTVMPQIGGVDIVPSGGTSGQVLTKDTGTDYDYSWQTIGGVPTNRNLTAGTGLTGGGDLSADRTFNVIGANSIVANANDIQLVNDSASPGNNMVYGTNGAGTKGWKSDPAGSVFGSQFASQESDGNSSTSSTSYQTKLTFVTSSLPSGSYRIGYSCETNGTNTSGRTEVLVQRNGTDISNTQVETEDDDDWISHSGFRITGTISGVQTITMQWRVQGSGHTATIRKARLEIWRVA